MSRFLSNTAPRPSGADSVAPPEEGQLKLLRWNFNGSKKAPLGHWARTGFYGRAKVRMTPMSQSELETMNRQVATLNDQLAELANLLEFHLGDTTELAMSARAVQQEFASLAQRIHRHAALPIGGLRADQKLATA